jgi:hypothetical protein
LHPWDPETCFWAWRYWVSDSERSDIVNIGYKKVLNV